MVDTVLVDLRRIGVLERQLHTVVHVEAALRLADQAEVGIVHHDVDVRQLELRADGELLDHELEVVVSRQRHDAPRRVGCAHAVHLRVHPGGKRGIERPQERPPRRRIGRVHVVQGRSAGV